MTVNKIHANLELGFDLPAFPGMTISEIQTPCLMIDMDSFDYNLRRMANLIAPYNVSLRPHAKMHKSVDVARQQLANSKPPVYVARKSQKQRCLQGQAYQIF